MKIGLAILLGLAFGFALYYIGAANPEKLLEMLRLRRLALMKIIVFAIGFASVLLSIAQFFGILDLSHLNIKSLNLGVIVGGIIFGVGFGYAGTCPGTSVAGIGGAGAKRAIVTVIGGLAGAFTYTLTYKYFEQMGLFRTLDYGKLTWFEISNEYPSVFSIGFLGLFIVGIVFMGIGLMLPMKGRG